jgi:hypothetical protein
MRSEDNTLYSFRETWSPHYNPDTARGGLPRNVHAKENHGNIVMKVATCIKTMGAASGSLPIRVQVRLPDYQFCSNS